MNRKAMLCTVGLQGNRDQVVVIVGRTLHNYRVTCPGQDPVKLTGLDRWLYPGQQALVPVHSIRTIH